jgi:hypothetical protein
MRRARGPWVAGAAIALLPLPANAATYYVAPSGSDAAGVTGTEAAPFAS